MSLLGLLLPFALVTVFGPAPQPAPTGRLAVTDVTPGEGAPASVGDRVTVHIRALDPEGGIVADTERRGLPFIFVLSGAPRPATWRNGVSGMRPGGVRRIVAPPAFVAGMDGNPPVVPPGVTLTLTVRLLEVVAPGQE